MIEILFTESAAGSMKLAKGIKNIVGSSTAVFIHSSSELRSAPKSWKQNDSGWRKNTERNGKMPPKWREHHGMWPVFH